MGEISFKTIEKAPRHTNTIREFSREIQPERYQYVIDRVSSNIPYVNKVCLIFGMGKHPRSTYTALENIPGIEVIWYGSLIPVLLSPLRILIASYEGVIKLTEREKIKYVFGKLSEMSMVGLYIFDISLEHSFIKAIKKKKFSNDADEIVKNDSGYFIYTVDADNEESSTGIYEIISYGKDCPKEIIGSIFHQ